MTGNCAQLGNVVTVDKSIMDICSPDHIREEGLVGNSCAVKPYEAMVNSISSAVQSLSK